MTFKILQQFITIIIQTITHKNMVKDSKPYFFDTLLYIDPTQ